MQQISDINVDKQKWKGNGKWSRQSFPLENADSWMR